MNEVNDCDYGIILDQCVKWKSLSLRRFSFKVAHFVLIRGGARKAEDDVVCDGWHPIWLIFNLFTSWLPIAVQLVGLEKSQTNLNTRSCYLYKWLVRKSPVTKMGRKKEEMEVMPLPQGPVKSRSCTDILCLLLFLVCIVAWGGVSYVGFKVRSLHCNDKDNDGFAVLEWKSRVADVPDQ